MCPADAKSAAGTACTDDGNPCSRDECDGRGDDCQHPAGNGGAVCRAAAGDCDVAETCTGTSTACPADAKSPAGTVCRASAGACDAVETCDGAGNSCPADDFQPSSVVCRAANGGCDLAESCPGNGPDCPADAKKASGTACTDDGNPCSRDTCDGSSDDCQHPTGKPLASSHATASYSDAGAKSDGK